MLGAIHVDCLPLPLIAAWPLLLHSNEHRYAHTPLPNVTGGEYCGCEPCLFASISVRLINICQLCF